MDTLNITNGDIILEFFYLLSALFFVYGLKLLSSPDTARKGNMWAGTGMIMAMIATMVLHRDSDGDGIKGANLAIILGAIAFGGVIGGVIARRIKMTAMPQLVSFFNATGGAASALVALIEFSNPDNESGHVVSGSDIDFVEGSLFIHDTLTIYGNLSIGDTLDLTIDPAGILIIRGDFTANDTVDVWSSISDRQDHRIAQTEGGGTGRVYRERTREVEFGQGTGHKITFIV